MCSRFASLLPPAAIRALVCTTGAPPNLGQTGTWRRARTRWWSAGMPTVASGGSTRCGGGWSRRSPRTRGSPQADQRPVRDGGDHGDVSARARKAPRDRARRRLLRIVGRSDRQSVIRHRARSWGARFSGRLVGDLARAGWRGFANVYGPDDKRQPADVGLARADAGRARGGGTGRSGWVRSTAMPWGSGGR